MKLITELIEFALKHGMLTEEHKRKLQRDGFYIFFEDADDEYQSDSEDLREDELDQAYNDEFYHLDKRHRGKRKSHPAGPKLTVEELNQRIQEEWKKLTEEFPLLESILNSWKAGKLERVLADGFTLNDIYALMYVKRRDFREFSGPAPTAYRQLLRQVGNVKGKYSWVIKSKDAASMVEFPIFRQQIFEEIGALYEADRERFGALSRPNGKLYLPFGENIDQTDTTSMKVWTILNLPSMPVTPEMIKTILTWKPELTLAMQMNLDYITNLLSNLEKRDWSSLIVITERAIDNTILKSVIIPKGVTEIENWAFYRCSSLTSVVIPEGVVKIGASAFSDCSSLTSVTIPRGVTEIKNYAFRRCSSLTSVVIPEGMEKIGNEAFRECTSLTSVTIPEGVTTIGSDAFCCCSSLTSVTIPEGVTIIENSAFHSCASLTSVEIPKGVKAIEDGAFFCCSSLTSVVIPEGVKTIGIEAFFHCNSLTSVVIPKDVKWVSDGTFRFCYSLTSVVIPEGVMTIGIEAFEDCTSLTLLVIPNSVTTIRSSAFHGCKSLTSVVIPEGVSEIGKGVFAGCSSLTSAVIPEGLKKIGDEAFHGCSSLTSVVIPKRVTQIGNGAFDNCSNLTIHAPAGAYAEKYAKYNNIPFQPLEEE